MFNVGCLFVDAIIALAFNWNTFATDNGLEFLLISETALAPVFELFEIFCGPLV